MWRLCALCAVLVSPVRARSSVCDDGRTNLHLDLPERNVYMCPGDHIPPSSQVYPSIATKYKEEKTYHACMDVVINYTAAIPNSGVHRPVMAKYGEYIYCPPQRWVHNLQHAGMAFLYHPCVDPQLKEAFALVARSCFPRHIITPHPSLSRERPIALVTWCSTLEMSHVNVTEMRNWLKENLPYEHWQETVEDGTYLHLLTRRSLTSKSSVDICQKKMLNNTFLKKRGRPFLRILRKRRAVFLASTVVQDTTTLRVLASISSTTLMGLGIDKTTKMATPVTQPARFNVSSSRESFTSAPSVSLAQDSHTGSVISDIHSRETQGNDQVTPSPGVRSSDLSDNVTLLVGSEVSPEKVQHSQPKVTHEDQASDSPQKETSVNPAPRPEPTQLSHPATDLKLPPTLEVRPSNGQKPECSCQHDTAAETPAKAQRRLGAGQRKSNEGISFTPRTEEATWAAASLIFLFSLLTFSVLYTQIYKKFRRSQSLYWAPEIHSEDKESVASIIKRRLVQGHSRRKKWFGRKKSPAVLYESLSESSE